MRFVTVNAMYFPSCQLIILLYLLPTAITHTPSEPMIVRSELTESLPAPSHRAPPDQDATASLGTSLVTDTTTSKVPTYVRESSVRTAPLHVQAYIL